MPHPASLLTALLAAGNVALGVVTLLTFPQAAEQARLRNEGHVRRLEATERARCWDTAPERPDLAECVMADRFFEVLAQRGEQEGAWIAAADAALACRCGHITADAAAFERLVSMSLPSDERGSAGQSARLELALRLARSRQLLQVAAHARLLSSIASNRHDTTVAALATLRAALVSVRRPAGRDRRLAMDAVAAGIEVASSHVGTTSLAWHESGARALGLPALLHECVASGRCEGPLVARGHLTQTELDAYAAAHAELASELAWSIASLEDRRLDWEGRAQPSAPHP